MGTEVYNFGLKFQINLNKPSLLIKVKIKEYVDKGGNLNYECKSQDYQTPLQHCAKLGRYDLCKVLLESNASVNYINRYGETALFSAVIDNQVEICDLLTKYGADVNFTLSNGESILSFAVNLGNLQITRILLQNGADPNYRNPFTLTSINILNFAAEKSLYEICTLLQQHGARIDLNYDGPSVLFLAARDNQLELCRNLINQNVNVNQSYKGETPLHIATRMGCNLNICEVLLKNGANMEAKSSQSETPLLVAVRQGSEKISDLLISKGANTTIKDINGNSLLILAAKSGNENICRQLLTSGSLGQEDLNMALLESVKTNAIKACEIFINAGADIRYKHKVLVEAVKNNQYEICEMLINKGAHQKRHSSSKQPQEYSLQGQKALYEAIQLGYTDICLLFVNTSEPDTYIPVSIDSQFKFSSDNNQNQPEIPLILVAARKGNIKVCNLLLRPENGLNDNQLRRILWWEALSTSSSSYNILHYLTQTQTDLNFKVDQRNPILYLATEQEQYQTCQILLNQGANVNERNYKNETALYIAVQKGNKNIVELLRQYGASLDCKNEDELPIWYLALENGSYEVFLYLYTQFNINEYSVIQDKTVTQHAIKFGHFEIVRWLVLDRSSFINSFLEKGSNLLYEAAENNQMQIFEYLMQQGAQIDGKDTITQSTALYRAIDQNLDLLAESLILYGANVNEVNKDSQSTALMLAVSKNQLPVCEFLLGSGADIHYQASNGDSAMKLAKKGKNKSIIQLLVRHGGTMAPQNQNQQESSSQQGNIMQTLSIRNLFKKKSLLNEKLQVSKAQISKIQENDSNMCIICMGEIASHALIHGEEAHVCLCQNCVEFYKPKKGKRKENCPLCRKTIDSTIKIYF